MFQWCRDYTIFILWYSATPYSNAEMFSKNGKMIKWLYSPLYSFFLTGSYNNEYWSHYLDPSPNKPILSSKWCVDHITKISLPWTALWHSLVVPPPPPHYLYVIIYLTFLTKLAITIPITGWFVPLSNILIISINWNSCTGNEI